MNCNNNLFKRIRPIADAQKKASANRLNLYKNTNSFKIQTDVKNILDQPVNRAESGLETTVSKGDNSFIVLGKSREDSIVSGPYAVSGVVNANSIDVVVGLGYAPSVKKSDLLTGSVNPSFIYDKARVYLTEGMEIDKAFGITKYGTSDNNEKFLSSVVAKADAVRIISRSNVKIITGKILDDDNSTSNTSAGGVELISVDASNGEDASLQPMVLGNNLKDTLNDMIEHINNLHDLLSDYITLQMQWDKVIAEHMHLNVFPNTPDPSIVYNVVPKLIKSLDSIAKIEIDKTINSAVTNAKMQPISKTSFLSSYHKLN